MVLFDDAFHITGYKIFIRVVIREIGYAYDLQVQLGLKKMRDIHIDEINIINVLNIVFNDM